MLEQVTTFLMTNWQHFIEFTKLNPVIAGIFSLWGLGVTTFIIKQIPRTIKSVIERQFTVSMNIHSNDNIFYFCDVWCNKQNFTTKLRTLRALSGRWGGDNEETNITAGYGIHWFFYGWRLIKYQRTKEDSNATSTNKEEIQFTTFGRNQNTLRNLLTTIEKSYQKKNDNVKIYEWDSGDHWRFAGETPRRPWVSITTNDNIKDEIITHIEDFLKPESQQWKLNNGIHNKITIQLEGPPGTGKTSLVRAVASKLKRNISVISLSEISDKGLKRALGDLRDDVIVLIEDIDSSGATKKRRPSKSTEKKPKRNIDTIQEQFEDESGSEDFWSMLTIQGLLNAMDGINSSDGRILFTTTNHPDKIDPAILRKGRTNYRFYMGPLNKESICSYLNRFFPETDIDLEKYEYLDDLSAAILEGHVLDFKDDLEAILSKVTTSEIVGG